MPPSPALPPDDGGRLRGSLASSRREVRRRGGAMGIGVSALLWFAGVLLGVILPGPLGGAASFLCMLLALPVLPILGIPASSTPARLLLAIVVSATLWWFVGQITAARATHRPVAGWREWVWEFVPVAVVFWLGGIVGLALGAMLLAVS